MVEYKCHNCDKIYTHKGDFNRHINKKIPCGFALSERNIMLPIPQENAEIPHFRITQNKSNDELQCKYCLKTFTRKDILTRHMNDNCKIKKQESESDKEIIKKLLLEFEGYKAKTSREMESLKKELNILKVTQPGNINNIDKQQNVDKQQINNNNINNIKLVAFGSEDLGYIEDSIIKKILAKGFSSVPKLIEHIHFDKDKPEYHNVFISNIRTKKALTYDGDDWILRESNDVFDALKTNGCNYIDEKFKELSDKGELTEPITKKIKRFIDQRDEDEEQVKLNNDIEMLLYNKRKVTMNTKKKLEDQEKKQIAH
jgi:uncharacterized C2H2 Zn-finger protein